MSDLAATARELNERFGDLLHPQRRTPDLEVQRAFETARERLYGCTRTPAADGQMMLDLQGTR